MNLKINNKTYITMMSTTKCKVWVLMAGMLFCMGNARAQADVAKNNNELQQKAGEWVAALALTDQGKIKRVEEAVTQHLTAVRDWHNAHAVTQTPEASIPLRAMLSVIWTGK